MAQGRGFGAWLAAVAVLVLAGVAVPYGLLAGREDWSVGLFWLGFGLAVVVLIALGLRNWGNAE